MTTSVDEVQGVNPPVSTTLQAADRCDRCAGQAYVRVAIAGMTLDFCAHHFRESEDGLTAKGAAVTIDQRSKLTVKPGASV